MSLNRYFWSKMAFLSETSFFFPKMIVFIPKKVQIGNDQEMAQSERKYRLGTISNIKLLGGGGA